MSVAFAVLTIEIEYWQGETNDSTYPEFVKFIISRISMYLVWFYHNKIHVPTLDALRRSDPIVAKSMDGTRAIRSV